MRKRLVEAAEKAAILEPLNQHAVALGALALRKLGDERENVINDYDRFVQIFDTRTPRRLLRHGKLRPAN